MFTLVVTTAIFRLAPGGVRGEMSDFSTNVIDGFATLELAQQAARAVALSSVIVDRRAVILRKS